MTYESFDQYWLAYLAAHSKPATRVCHYIGTVLGLFLGIAASFFVVWWALLVLGPIGYGIALASHPLVQGNRPFATRPLWGLASDLRMLWFAVTNQLRPHIERAVRTAT
ncbi:DUF962 domain-containing protein [Pseudomonas sp. SO81]|uniref:DUF962 domain-containing protein n=1 Tax=Pseudomonas sp. SO81 TaxID=2983246 RepID=UPI00338E883C|nr:hypothetical protein OH686_20510 [Pseudomonas sp. SO81]